jgi:ubiquinone/menaquinone biosynthesis C-methylase UbiE
VALREAFEQAPELYDRARPGYPTELFDDVARLLGLRAGSRVLELGCGTGQATTSLARCGYEVVAVELGAGLADVARRKLASFPAVRVVNAAFEEWPLPAERFDAVFAATSFHWIERPVRVSKSAEALKPGGALAVVSTHHVAGGDEQFFVDVQRCYERWDPNTTPGSRLPAASDIRPEQEEFDADGRFGRMAFRRYERELTYSASEYRDLLLTYSGHRAMEADAQRSLLSCIVRLVDERYGGQVTKRYMNELAVAYKA